MYLKKYQQRVVSELNEFFDKARETRESFEMAAAALPEHMRPNLNYVQETFSQLKLVYKDQCKNGLGHYYPRLNLKVPTGGGKTILAVEAIKEYQTVFAKKKTGLVVWIVPKEIIYKQTVDKLRDKGNALRQLLDQASGGRTIIAEKGQALSKQDIEENLVILFIMAQSVSRANNKEALKVFRDSGGFDSFFPEDNRYDIHHEWKQAVPNLDTMWESEGQAQLITSLGNAVRVSKPFIIIDEFHKVFTPTAKKTIDNLNPELILGLSATPKENMNIVSTVTGLELKEEEMVKLDLHIIPPTGNIDNDWKSMLQRIIEHRDTLEQEGINLRRETGRYIRPIALIQCERTGKDQRGKDYVHSEDVREHLIESGINPSEIAVKSSETNEIENIDLLSSDCPIRFIITKEALTEGWDCPFAYILGVIPNVKSNTSVTQLIGRILRQPGVKKTGVLALDESYVYYSKGGTNELLEKVITGFKNEGLGDLVSQMKVTGNDDVNPKVETVIKEEFTKYEYAFYLPTWVLNKEDGTHRPIKYAMDIAPYIDFDSLQLTADQIATISASLSDEKSEQNSFSVTIDDTSKIQAKEDVHNSNISTSINITYITRRFGEIIDNAFLARRKADEWLAVLIDSLGDETLAKYFSFITAQLTDILAEHRDHQEKQIFERAVEDKKMELIITTDTSIGFKVPYKDVITVDGRPNTYNYNLYDKVELTSLNSLEKNVINILEKQETILWWFRNRVSKGWYGIQGWKPNKIRPDFVVAKKKGDNEIEIVYLLESKGEHLLGNKDTTYKNEVFQKMTQVHQDGNMKTYQTELDFGDMVLNEAVEAYLVEGGKEEAEIRKLMK